MAGYLLSERFVEFLRRQTQEYYAQVAPQQYAEQQPWRLIPHEFCRYRLTEALAAYGSAAAVRQEWDGADYADTETTLTVYDVAGQAQAVDATGWAIKPQDVDRWEALAIKTGSLRPFALTGTFWPDDATLGTEATVKIPCTWLDDDTSGYVWFKQADSGDILPLGVGRVADGEMIPTVGWADCSGTDAVVVYADVETCFYGVVASTSIADGSVGNITLWWHTAAGWASSGHTASGYNKSGTSLYSGERVALLWSPIGGWLIVRNHSYWARTGTTLNPATSTDDVEWTKFRYLDATTGGADNVAIVGGNTAAMTGGKNVCIGKSAGSALTSGQQNFLMGYKAGQLLSTHSYNVLIGSSAGLYAGTGFQYNVGIGSLVMQNTTSERNVAIGYSALAALTSGSQNLAIGWYAGTNITTGSYNVAVGPNTLRGVASGMTGSSNTAIGVGAAYSSSFNSSNTVMIGYEAGKAVTTTSDGTILIGYQAGVTMTSACGDNVVIGRNAANAAAGSCTNNTLVGAYAGYTGSALSNNVFLGYKAGYRCSSFGSALIIDNQDRGTELNEMWKSLIWGIFDATDTSQWLNLNAQVSILGAIYDRQATQKKTIDPCQRSLATPNGTEIAEWRSNGYFHVDGICKMRETEAWNSAGSSWEGGITQMGLDMIEIVDGAGNTHQLGFVAGLLVSYNIIPA